MQEANRSSGTICIPRYALAYMHSKCTPSLWKCPTCPHVKHFAEGGSMISPEWVESSPNFLLRCPFLLVAALPHWFACIVPTRLIIGVSPPPPMFFPVCPFQDILVISTHLSRGRCFHKHHHLLQYGRLVAHDPVSQVLPQPPAWWFVPHGKASIDWLHVSSGQ